MAIIEGDPEIGKKQTIGNVPDMNSNSLEKRLFKTLPAPFHVKGRRPSTGCNKMCRIPEE